MKSIFHLFGFFASCLLSPWAWLLTIAFLVLGASISSLLGLDLPAQSMYLALLGAPLGAWLEGLVPLAQQSWARGHDQDQGVNKPG